MSSAAPSNEDSFAESKGKGKAAAEQVPGGDTAMDEDDSDSDEEEHNVEPDEDGLEEIDTNNIVGSRTRGAQIDFAKAAAETPADEEDEEEDEDFQPPEGEGEAEEDTHMSG